MAGVPISLLPDGITPYTGEERFAFVQDSDTKANSLESFTSFYEQYFITYDLLGSLSGNWQETYNLFTIKGALWDVSYSITSNLSSNWNSVYTTVNTYSGLWGRNPGDFCGTVVYMRDITSCAGTDTINISANLDLEGYSINNIGNSSLVFESGAKFSSNAEGGVHILPNPSNIPGQYGTTIGLSNDAPASQAVASGKDSIANASMAFAHGLENIASAPYSIAAGGKGNIIDPLGLNSGIIGGETNALSGESSGIIAGDTHKLNAYASSIMGGSAHDLRADASIIAGGDSNVINGGYSSSIISSQGNTITRGSNNAIIASPGSTLTDSTETVIFGGKNTDITSNFTAAIATNFSAITADHGIVIGGQNGYAYHSGAKVFPDTSASPFTSLSSESFNIQASGLRLVDGNEELGYVLTCDGDGTGTWQEPAGGANVTVSDDAPIEPEGGDLWFDSDEAILYVNYIDPSQTSFWIEVGGASGSTNNTNWNSAYTTVSANSASWDAHTDPYNDSLLQATSGDWNSAYTEITNIGLAGNNITNADVISANAVHSISAFTHYQDILISELSGFSVEGDVSIAGQVDVTGTLSANDIVYALDGDSAQWNSNYTTVSANSASWGSDAVDSVNTKTGVVVLDADDIDDTTTTHKFATQTQLDKADNALQPADPTLQSITDNGSTTTSSVHFGNTITTGNNTAIGSTSTAIGGQGNSAIGASSEVLGGDGSTASGQGSSVIGGSNHTNAANWTATVGGLNQTANSGANRGAILGGYDHTLKHADSVIIGGNNITSDATSTVFVPNLNVKDGFKMPTGAVNNYILTTAGNGVGTWQANIDALQVAASDETTDLTTGITTTFRAPYAMELTDVRASVTTAPVGADITVDVTANGTTIFSTIISIDGGSKTSVGSASPRVISTTSIPDDAEIKVDIKTVGSTTKGNGLKLSFIGYKS